MFDLIAICHNVMFTFLLLLSAFVKLKKYYQSVWSARSQLKFVVRRSHRRIRWNVRKKSILKKCNLPRNRAMTSMKSLRYISNWTHIYKHHTALNETKQISHGNSHSTHRKACVLMAERKKKKKQNRISRFSLISRPMTHSFPFDVWMMARI